MASQTNNLTSPLSDRPSIQTLQSAVDAIKLSLAQIQESDTELTFEETFLAGLLDWTESNPPNMNNIKKKLENHIEDEEVVIGLMYDFEKILEEERLKDFRKELSLAAKLVSISGLRSEDVKIGVPSAVYQSWTFHMVLVASAFAILSWGLKPFILGGNRV
ncbi:hypothetical protein G7Y89_g8634 [Cudoniella acicularis]|uniref:Uncharacterized protein n=1 Tax=Cudoniella acicularis TaxID=354080 RepID=A0A8H4RIT0_9HELO|nr:hypothetical protein G7Y89_g8634 [Cudoniella acicularis]